MHYSITHTTLYTYSEPVQLGSHCIKLCPRNDGSQHLQHFNLEVYPTPQQVTNLLDPEGNVCQRLWFKPVPASILKFITRVEVETLRTNPFDFLTAPWAMTHPLDYPSSMKMRLSPYLVNHLIHPQVIAFAHDVLYQVGGDIGQFLTQLTQAIRDRCYYVHRAEGHPQPAGQTLAQQTGTCRDFAVLWIEACRAVGLAARFVSGYQQGDPDQPQRELHAWAEVYVPGGGWRGFDPTLGLAVAEGHVALAAAAEPSQASPVNGHIQSVSGTAAKSSLDFTIEISYDAPEI